MSYISNLSSHEVEALREHLLGNFEAFSRFFFKVLTGTAMLDVDYYSVLFSAIQKLIDHESSRMIINIPPRAGKTLIVSQCLPLYAWCRNSSGHTILTGFNSDVLAECSGYIRAVMMDEDFKIVFPDVVGDPNKKSVEKLGTMSSGVIHAIPTSGKITGKGAGTLLPDFSGIMCIDDVIKPDDANSPAERNKINNRFQNTLLSRLAQESTPLVIIMQRLHSDDLAGFLMKGGDGTRYDWLNVPGLIQRNTGSKEWYDEQIERFGYTHVNPITYDLDRSDELFDEDGDSSFWDMRKTTDTLKKLREADAYTFYSQYMGMPVNKSKAGLDADYIRYYDVYDPQDMMYTFITADTASTKQTYSDYSVFAFWGYTRSSELMLLDIIIDKWETPELVIEARKFWESKTQFNMNEPCMSATAFYMEDKSSGQFLNQQYLRDGTVRVEPVPRDGTAANDKFARFLNTIPYFKSNRISIPRNHEHTLYIKQQLVGMTADGNATGNDDVCDVFSDAVAVAYDSENMSYEDWS